MSESFVGKLWRAEARPILESAYESMGNMASRASSMEFLPVSNEKWHRGLNNASSYRQVSAVYSSFDTGPCFGQPGASSVELKLADTDAAEENLDAAVIVQAAAVLAINYSPYELLLSHPALDRDIATTHGVRRGFMVLPACEGALPRDIVKQTLYDGHAVLETIASNQDMCELLETLRNVYRTEEGQETAIDILRPDTLKSQLHIASDVDNGRLRDTYRYVNERHPYVKLLRDIKSIREDVERPEAEGGFNFALDRKVKVGKKEIESKRGSGPDQSHLIPVPVIEHIEKWCEKNIHRKIRTADVRRRNLGITVSRLDGHTLDHHFQKKESGQDDGVRGFGSFADAPFEQRNSGLYLQLDINVWPVPPARVIDE